MKAIPFRMTPDVIRREVGKDLAGVYVLGDVERGRFRFKYVGRSDSCLRTRLLTHEYLYRDSYFIFCCTEDAAHAYMLESKWWHDCRNAGIRLRNKNHPDAPAGSLLTCPYCQFRRDMANLFPFGVRAHGAKWLRFCAEDFRKILERGARRAAEMD